METLLLPNRQAWEQWLELHHGSSPGVWLHLGKKGGATTELVYADALEVALCFGWIDGQVRRCDEHSYLQRWTPRRKRSLWSRLNVARAEALIAQGKMRPAGLAEVERARADGRWAAAYDSPSTIEMPPDFARALESRPLAAAHWQDWDKTNRFAVLHRLQTSSPARRAALIEQFLLALERDQKLH